MISKILDWVLDMMGVVLTLVFVVMIVLMFYLILIYPKTEAGKAAEAYKQELKMKCLEGDMGACSIYEADYGESSKSRTTPIFVPIKY